MQRDFCRRGYPSDLVRNAARRASMTPREKCLQYRRKEDVIYKGIMAALDFTPPPPTMPIKRIVAAHWHMVSDLPGCDNPPRWGLRKTKPSKDILIKSDMRNTLLPTPVVMGYHHCGSCSCCAQAWNTKEIDLPSKNFYKRLDFFLSCSTKMCVYLVMCSCDLCYVGSTRSKLRICMTELTVSPKLGMRWPMRQWCNTSWIRGIHQRVLNLWFGKLLLQLQIRGETLIRDWFRENASGSISFRPFTLRDWIHIWTFRLSFEGFYTFN